jgi:hypothetical protein
VTPPARPIKPRFSLGTSIHPSPSPEAELLAKSLNWLIAKRHSDGTWGDGAPGDNYVATNHAVLTLLAVGFSPYATLVRPTLEYLAEIDTDRYTSFFWRAGPLLNLPGYEDLVESDMNYIWANRRRIGSHKDYPIPMFLLKLLLFSDPPRSLSFTENDVLRWILKEWDPVGCWYNRTSMSSMALALIHNLRFSNKRAVIDRTQEFLVEQFVQSGDSGQFSKNLIDDGFTIYNLAEADRLLEKLRPDLAANVGLAVDRIRAQADHAGVWQSPPPFGGHVDEQIYATSVSIRALASYWTRTMPTLLNETALLTLDQCLASAPALVKGHSTIEPFWGTVDPRDEPICFVLMPFTPKNLTDIYERYVKTVVEQATGLTCQRADDFNAPRPIMSDIWTSINTARVIVADLTDQNPNVFYELGLAHCLGKRVILLAQSLEYVPFDLRHIRLIIYPNTLEGYEYLSTKLRLTLSELELLDEA